MKYLYGIKPTGRIHIGNYLGGLKLAIEKGADVMIANYHSWTKPYYYKKRFFFRDYDFDFENELRKLGANTYHQHQESIILAWTIQCITPVSDLERMTQWKDKGKGNVGLLTYPCLMAADIIIAEPDYVIVGTDQLQHLEFYRRTCKRLGIKDVAKTLITKTPKIMSIKDPNKKMSKSIGDEHCLYLGDKANRKKIIKSPTTVEGVKNLKQIAIGLGITYNSKNNKESKEKLIEALAKI